MWREKVYRAALVKNIENEINASLIYSGVYCILVGSTRRNVRNVDVVAVDGSSCTFAATYYSSPMTQADGRQFFNGSPDSRSDMH